MNEQTSSVTPIKQAHFSQILGVHIKVCEAILARHRSCSWVPQEYLYVDTHSGDGRWRFKDETGLGSPLQFARMATMSRLPNVRMVCIDNDQKAVTALSNELRMGAIDESKMTAHVWHGECAYWLERIATMRNQYGIVYSDPYVLLDFDPWIRFFDRPETRRIDVLFNHPATSLKRCLHLGKPMLCDAMARIKKRYWMVRRPEGHHQWTMILGTNWADFPKFNKINMVRVDTNEGKSLICGLSIPHGTSPCDRCWHDVQDKVQQSVFCWNAPERR